MDLSALCSCCSNLQPGITALPDSCREVCWPGCVTQLCLAAPTQYKKTKLAQDYAAVASDAAVLKRPLKDVLTAADVKSVFDYPRDVREWCVLAISRSLLRVEAGLPHMS